MRAAKAIWSFLGRADLTLYVLLALVADLCAGFFHFRAEPQLFGPLDRLMLWDWITTYGRFHLAETWWFFVFMGLMLLLVLNTSVCTINRVAGLIRIRSGETGRLDYLLRFSPHLMHLAFLVLLVSMLASYVVGVNLRNNILSPGRTVDLAQTGHRLRLEKMEVEYYQGRRLSFFENRAIDQDLTLAFTDPRGRETVRHLGINKPVRYRGFSVHIKNYQPQTRNRAGRPGWANLIVRKDPGVGGFFAGVGLFVLGLTGYLIQTLRKNARSGPKEQAHGPA